MDDIKVGDVVARKSYGKDINFKVNEIIKKQDVENMCVLTGVDVRLIADAPQSDLEKIETNKKSKKHKK
jgi:spore coat assembly protein